MDTAEQTNITLEVKFWNKAVEGIQETTTPLKFGSKSLYKNVLLALMDMIEEAGCNMMLLNHGQNKTVFITKGRFTQS